MVLKRPAAASVSNLPPREVPIIAVPEKPDWLDEADESAQIQALLVTIRKSKRETRQEYVNRLRRVAKSLPASFINKSIGDMVRRCNRLYAAKGGHFEEGGRGD